MKIELDEPFSHFYRFGYIVVNPENRRNVVLFNSQEDRTTISYAKYLMCVKLGYILTPEFEVDHIDDDKTNDFIDNLQVLTKAQNKLKQEYRFAMFEQEHYGFICPICNINFLRDKRRSYQYISTGKQPTCSRMCGYIQTSITLKNRNA